MNAIRKPPAPSLEELVREFLIEQATLGNLLVTYGLEAELVRFVRSIPPINAEAERAEELRAQRDSARATLARVGECLARIREEAKPYARELTNETGADHPNMEGRIVDDCDTALRLIDELEER